MAEKYTVSAAPHIFNKITTPQIMRQVLFALVPAVLASVYFFRARAGLLIIVSVAACILTEAAFQKLRQKPATIADGSAVLTGLLLALVLPPAAPLWVVGLGGIIAIVLGKQIFGGLGHNIFNPALVGRAFLLIAFPKLMTTWTKPISLDAVTSATPLGLMKFDHIQTSIADLFVGNVSGSLGETSALAIILGGLYLLIRKFMGWRVPVGFLGSVVLLGWIFNRVDAVNFPSASFHLFSGGLMLGAIFMATDPVTNPVTKLGRWIFGIGCGVIVVIIRLLGGMPEGVTFAILIMNAATPLVNMLTRPRRFGG